MSNMLVPAVLAHLRQWADAVRTDLGAAGVYVFGSLIHRDGAQFGERSDVDLVVLIPEQADNAIKRTAWVERMAERKQALEADLGRILGRTDTDKVICSVVAVTGLEIAGDVHKDGARGFFAQNHYLDLLSGEARHGLPDAGKRQIAERLVIECLRFAQKKRNVFLGISASGRMGLADYDEAEPLPKDVMRHAAMAQHLREGVRADPGAEYDTQNGLDFLSHHLYEHRRHAPVYADLQNRLSIRRGGRGTRELLSGRDQLLLVEIVYDTAAERLAIAERKRAEELPRLGRHSTVFFAERVAQAFPGVRDIVCYDDPETIKTRLERLLQPPLVYKDAMPIWWWRDGNLQIEKFKYNGDGIFLMDGTELNIRRIAAVNPGPYNRAFVYVELDAMPPTGLYNLTETRIAEVMRGEGDFTYYWEEYGIVDGKHLITRAELDDGAAEIEGNLQDVRGRNELRSRYVTPYNFVIAAARSPINNPDFDKRLADTLDAILKGEDRLRELMEMVLRLPVQER